MSRSNMCCSIGESVRLRSIIAMAECGLYGDWQRPTVFLPLFHIALRSL